uniref:Large ribosomal subunit protein uL16c n=1 Tax=Pseudochlorodesmis sp. HV01306a TaxID=2358488 RepID=A0A386AY17_9CHLO|nr:ribosomal protein L16 [Pseudochlorodesmis sp. HV01306a]
MLQPKRTKYRKMHRGRLKGNKLFKATLNNLQNLRFGDAALQALEPCWLTGRQIEAGRRVISRLTRRGGKLWIHPFPDKPVTFRPPETRMGSGKGAPEYWVAVIKPGQLIYEIKGVALPLAKDALKRASYKMPIKTKILIVNK